MDALTGRTGQDGHEDPGATAARASDVPEPRVPTSERSRSEPASSWRRAEERSATGSPGEPTFSESYSGDPRSGGEDAGIAAATEFPTGPKTFDDDPADRGEPATSAQPGLSAGLPGGPGSPERGSSEEASSPGEPSFAGESGFSGEPGLSEWASGSEGTRFAGDSGPAEESGLSGGRRSEQWSLSSDSGRAEDTWLWERSFDVPGGSADRGAEELTGPAPTLPSLSDSSSSLPTGVVDSGLTDTGASGPPGTPLSTADSTSAADERPDRDPLLGSGSSWMEAAERSGDDEEPGDADLDRLGDWDVDSWDVASFGRGTAGYGGSRYDGSHSDGSPQDGYDSYESSRDEGAQHEGAQHGGPRYDSPQYDSPQYDSSWYDSYDLDGFGGAGRDDLSGDAVLREPEQLDRDPLGERDGSDRAAPDSAADHDEQARARSGKTLAEIRESLRLLQERSGTAAAARESAAQPAAQFVDPDDPLGDQGDPIGGGGRRRRHSDSEDVAAASAEPEPGEPASDLLGRYGVTEPERVQPREPDPEPVVEQPAEPSEDAGLADLLAEALVAYESGRQDPSHEQSRTDAPPSGGTPGGRRHVETDSSGAGVPASRHLQQSTSDSSVPRRHRRASADPASAQASWTPSAEAHARRHF